MITTIRVFKEVMCSTGSPLPSKEDNDGDLKPSGTSAFQISSDSGWVCARPARRDGSLSSLDFDVAG